METTRARLPAADAIHSVTCLLLGEIGDALVCTPTLHALREHYPTARFTLIVRKVAAPLFADNADIDDIIVFDVPTALRKLRFMLGLGFHRCDLWVDLQAPTFNTFGTEKQVFRRNALLMKTARSRHRLGFAVSALRPLLSHPVAPPDASVLKAENVVDTTLRLLDGRRATASRRKRLVLGEADKSWAECRWRTSFADGDTVLGLFFGAKQPAKFWPLDNVRTFVEAWLAADARHRILLLGGDHEKAMATAIVDSVPAALRARISSTVAAASLMQTAALMARCAVLVTTDSGPMHIADALDLPMVALLSHQNFQAVWRPLSANATVLARQVDCGPCLRNVCDRGNRCMADIPAAEVLAAVEAKLMQPAAGART